MCLETTIQGKKYILIDIPIKEEEDGVKLKQAIQQFGLLYQTMKYIHIDGGFWGSSYKVLLMGTLVPEEHVLDLEKFLK